MNGGHDEEAGLVNDKEKYARHWPDVQLYSLAGKQHQKATVLARPGTELSATKPAPAPGYSLWPTLLPKKSSVCPSRDFVFVLISLSLVRVTIAMT